MPRLLSSLALAWTASVADGASVARRLASIGLSSSRAWPGYFWGYFAASRFSTPVGTIPVTDAP